MYSHYLKLFIVYVQKIINYILDILINMLIKLKTICINKYKSTQIINKYDSMPYKILLFVYQILHLYIMSILLPSTVSLKINSRILQVFNLFINRLSLNTDHIKNINNTKYSTFYLFFNR